MDHILTQLLWIFTAIPVFAFFATLLWDNKQEKQITLIVQLTKFIYITASLAFAVLWIVNGGTALNQRLVTLYESNDFVFAIQFYYDRITAVYSITGAVLLFLVSTFSRYYMHRDAGFKRFFNTVLFFALGYNFIIFSGNFETLFIGWEVIGLSSFLLIAFYRDRYLPVKNGFKVLSLYRLGDIAIILVMWMMHHLMHRNISFGELDLAAQVGSDHHGVVVFIAAMILLAAMIKSAQFPFTSWLPRAMEGPTTSSAIFYGSLSVHIGVFLLLRTWPFWKDVEIIKIFVIIIGAITGVLGTLIARKQPTVKTQIAYSSAAQIGIIFIEVALGLHTLALIHFASNAFLRTYQLLVSPSVLNYLVHHQYFHFKPNSATGNNKIQNTLYTLGVKEWNLDQFMYRFFWSPFKAMGRILNFTGTRVIQIILSILVLLVGYVTIMQPVLPEAVETALPLMSCSIALLVILYAFSSRGSAIRVWFYLCLAHFFIICGLVMNHIDVSNLQLGMYVSGILLAGILGWLALRKVYAGDKDVNLDKYHGYVYEQKNTALLFLISTIGLIGFPVTAAFIGIDVFFTFVESGQVALIAVLALCFLFLELAAIRIYCRIFLGLHKKPDHPIAFRSS